MEGDDWLEPSSVWNLLLINSDWDPGNRMEPIVVSILRRMEPIEVSILWPGLWLVWDQGTNDNIQSFCSRFFSSFLPSSVPLYFVESTFNFFTGAGTGFNILGEIGGGRGR